MKFNFSKYLQHRKESQGLSDETIDFLIMVDSMQEVDGMDMEEVWKKKGVCLKEWCNAEKENENGK